LCVCVRARARVCACVRVRACACVHQVLWERLKEPAANWRKVYKALNVLDYCVKNGTKRFVEESRDCIHKIEDLKSFQYTEPNTGKDQGINVREKADILKSALCSGFV
jgi:epsin